MQSVVWPITDCDSSEVLPLKRVDLWMCIADDHGRRDHNDHTSALLCAQANEVALQPDGKTVAVGTGVAGSNGNFALARYNVGGTLDTTFSAVGRAYTDFGSSRDRTYAMAL